MHMTQLTLTDWLWTVKEERGERERGVCDRRIRKRGGGGGGRREGAFVCFFRVSYDTTDATSSVVWSGPCQKESERASERPGQKKRGFMTSGEIEAVAVGPNCNSFCRELNYGPCLYKVFRPFQYGKLHVVSSSLP